jgi:fibronectin-binding autotransporter adhesin
MAKGSAAVVGADLRACLSGFVKGGYQLDLVVLVYCRNDGSELLPGREAGYAHLMARRASRSWLEQHSFFLDTLCHRLDARWGPRKAFSSRWHVCAMAFRAAGACNFGRHEGVSFRYPKKEGERKPMPTYRQAPTKAKTMKHPIPSSSWLLLAISFTLLPPPAWAVLSYWDPEGAWGSYNTYTLGSLAGSWETASWSRNATGGAGAPADQGQATPQGFTEVDAAVFAVGAGATNSGDNTSTMAFTVTVGSDHTVAGFFDGSLNPHACIVTLSGPGRFLLPVANPGNALNVGNSSDGATGWIIFSNVLAGSGNLIAEGGGQAFFRATNTFSGGFQTGYSGSSWFGILNFNNPYAFGTGPIKIIRGYSGSAGALLAETDGLTLTNTVDWSGALSNAPYQNIVGTAPAGLTFSGPWTLGNKSVNVGSGGSGNLVTIAGPITGTGSFAKYNPGTLRLRGANTYSGATTVTAATLQFGVNNALPFGSGKGGVTVNGTLDLNGFNAQLNNLGGSGLVDNVSAGGNSTLTISNSTGTTTFSGTIQNSSGAISVVKVGGSTEILTGPNAWSGATTVSGGTLIIDGPSTWSGATTVTGGTLQIGNADANGQLGNGSTVTVNGTLSFKRTDSLTINNQIIGTGNVTQAGTGTLILNYANTYGGTTTITGGGTLQLAAANNVPATSYINVVSNLVSGSSAVSIFDLNNLGSLTYAYLSGAGKVINASGTLTINGNRLATGSSPLTYSCFSGVLDGSANLTKDGTHTMALRGQNTFSGSAVSILNGTLSVGAGPDRLPTASTVSVASSARFQLDASSQTVAALTGAGAVNLQGGTLILNPAGNVTFGGTIQNCDLPGASTASGNGLRGYYYASEDFNNLRAVRDDATVNFPNFAITNNVTALPDAGIASTNFTVRWLGQVLTPSTTGTYLFGMDSDDGARIWVNGVLVLDDWITQSHSLKSGLIDLAADTRYDIVVEYFQQTGGGQALLEWAQLGVSTTNVIPTSNLFLPGPGNLVKGGLGTLTLSGVNTYTGPTTVAAGTLDVQSAGGLDSQTVIVADQATLQLHSPAALSPATSLVLNAGSPAVKLLFNGTANINSLSLDGGATYLVNGLWGPLGSGVAHTDSHLSGPGLLNVMPCSTTNALLSITADPGSAYTLNFKGTPGSQYCVLWQTNVAQPTANWMAEPGSTNTLGPSGLWSYTATNRAPAFYRAKALDACP